MLIHGVLLSGKEFVFIKEQILNMDDRLTAIMMEFRSKYSEEISLVGQQSVNLKLHTDVFNNHKLLFPISGTEKQKSLYCALSRIFFQNDTDYGLF
jgi:hypothetical protein